jgi:hypothetical protein
MREICELDRNHGLPRRYDSCGKVATREQRTTTNWKRGSILSPYLVEGRGVGEGYAVQPERAYC